MPRAKPKRPETAKDHDFATIARNVVEHVIGEKLNGSPLLDPNAVIVYQAHR